MYCNKCAVKVNEQDMFCYNCGNQLKNIQVVSKRINSIAKTNAKCFNVFAILSLIIGIISFVGFVNNFLDINFLSLLGIIEDFEFIFSFNGIVFGILGIRSRYHRGKAITGLVLSSLTTYISIMMLILNYI